MIAHAAAAAVWLAACCAENTTAGTAWFIGSLILV